MGRGRDRMVLVIAIGASIFGPLSCGNDVSPVAPSSSSAASGSVSHGAVSVQLVEFRIHADPTMVPEGTVTFAVRNDGEYAHEFQVVTFHPGTTRLPTGRDGSFDEDGKGIEIIGAIPARRLGPGYSAQMTADLEPGEYVLVCNVVIEGPLGHAHYELGMSTDFSVT